MIQDFQGARIDTYWFLIRYVPITLQYTRKNLMMGTSRYVSLIDGNSLRF